MSNKRKYQKDQATIRLDTTAPAQRWSVYPETVRRRIKDGTIQASLKPGTRQYQITEIERIEAEGALNLPQQATLDGKEQCDTPIYTTSCRIITPNASLATRQNR